MITPILARIVEHTLSDKGKRIAEIQTRCEDLTNKLDRRVAHDMNGRIKNIQHTLESLCFLAVSVLSLALTNTGHRIQNPGLDIFGGLGYFVELQRRTESTLSRDGILVSCRSGIHRMEAEAGFGAVARWRTYVC